MMKSERASGPIMLFGSGETSPSGQKIFNRLLREFPRSSKIALLETPAGFELNAAQVVEKIADFLTHHLQNFHPHPLAIPARMKGTDLSPDSPEVVDPILEADLIFMGPGSPTYAVRQLEGSLAWNYVLARHGLGAGLAFSSAAVIASSAYALPIYEIYKVGEDLHWKNGLNLFSLYGLSLTFVPHWNNNDGGSELDTSRCFMGKSRFKQLLALLPVDQTVVGIDEHTGLYFDCAGGEARVYGKGSVTVMNGEDVFNIIHGDRVPFEALGHCHEPDINQVILPEIWEKALQFSQAVQTRQIRDEEQPAEIMALVKQRETARAAKDWVAADILRDQIRESGWLVEDSPEGPSLRIA
jgi:hypothetical protein